MNTIIKLLTNNVLIELVKRLNGKTLINLIIIATPIIIIWIYFTGLRLPSEVSELMKINKNLEIKIEELKKDNEFIMSRMYQLEKREILLVEYINENNDLIKKNNNEILKLRKTYNEKINSVNNYDTRQLDSFFTKRYKDYYR